MTRTEQIRTILQAYDELPELQDGFREVKERLYEMNETQERQHRKFASGNRGLSVPQAAKLFTVSHLLDGWNQPNKWTVDDILSVRNECLYAQAYAKRFSKELEQWAMAWTGPFSHVDYAELMQRAA